MARHIFQSIFKDGMGRIIPSATVSVYLAGTTTTANVYSAATGGSPVTSVTTASDGSFSFFVSDSDFSLNQRFKITMTKTDFATKSYDNITIFAPVPTGIYYPDANATDQGAATTGGYSLKDIIDAAGSNNITIKFRNSSGSATTSYTLTTSETIPATCAIEFEIGARIVQGGSATLTISGPVVGNPMHQWLSGFAAGDVVFGKNSVDAIYSEWWGAIADSDGSAGNGTDCTVALNCAILSILNASPTHRTPLHLLSGRYRITSNLDFTPTAQVTGFIVKGASGGKYNASGAVVNDYTTIVVDRTSDGIGVSFGDRTANYLAVSFNIENLIVRKAQGNTCNVTCLELNLSSSTFQHVHAYQGQIGLQFNGIGNTFIACSATSNGKGIAMNTNIGTTTTINCFFSCSFSYNSQEGLYDDNSQGSEFYGCDFQFNNRYGIYIDNSVTNEGNCATFYGGWVEGNNAEAGYTNQIYIKGHATNKYNDLKIDGTKINQGGSYTTEHIYLINTTNAVIEPIWLDSTDTQLNNAGNNNGLMLLKSTTSTGADGAPAMYPEGYDSHATLKSSMHFTGNINLDKWIEGVEITAPDAPAANKGRVFFRDNGSGKTQLCVIFNTGAIQVIATEP